MMNAMKFGDVRPHYTEEGGTHCFWTTRKGRMKGPRDRILCMELGNDCPSDILAYPQGAATAKKEKNPRAAAVRTWSDGPLRQLLFPKTESKHPPDIRKCPP